MALDKMVDDMVKETFATLEAFPELGLIDKPIKISPRRMRCLLLFSQQTMRVMVNGHQLVLSEDSDAPESLEQAARDAVPPPAPELPTPVAGEVDDLTEFRKWKEAKAKGQQP